MKNDYNKILDELMEKISKAVADEEYDKVVIFNGEASFKTPKSISNAKEEDLLAVPGVGINLVKKLKDLK